MEAFRRCILGAFVACSILSPIQGFANVFGALEEAILQDDLDAAEAQVQTLYRTASVVTSRAVVSLQAYEKVVRTLRAAQRLRDVGTEFKASEQLEDDIVRTRLAYNDFRSAWSAMPSPLPVSRAVVDLVNEASRRSREIIDTTEAGYVEAERRRLVAAEERRAAERREREEVERQRLAAAEAERRRSEAEETSRARARDERIEALNAAAVRLGYKGLNNRFGVGRFLYNASRGGSLEAGLNEVFWTELSDRDRRVDGAWRLSQVVDGWEIYELREWSRDELIQLSIAVRPSGGLPMEGKRLESGFYVFRGNMEFVTVMGAARIVQKFERVDLQPVN